MFFFDIMSILQVHIVRNGCKINSQSIVLFGTIKQYILRIKQHMVYVCVPHKQIQQFNCQLWQLKPSHKIAVLTLEQFLQTEVVVVSHQKILNILLILFNLNQKVKKFGLTFFSFFTELTF